MESILTMFFLPSRIKKHTYCALQRLLKYLFYKPETLSEFSLQITPIRKICKMTMDKTHSNKNVGNNKKSEATLLSEENNRLNISLQ